MKRKIIVLMIVMAVAGTVNAATQQQIQQAIDDGLAYLANPINYSSDPDEIWYPYTSDGTLAATASSALAFIEEGYLPNDGSVYGAQVAKMCNYIFNRAKADPLFGIEDPGQAYSGPGDTQYERYAEDYNNDGVFGNDGGNNQAIYFDPSNSNRDIYTNGIVAPVIKALGDALGENTVVGMGSATVSGMTYKEVMRDLVDWFAYGQVEPDMGNQRGGWRYTPNYSSSDNSTAQWGALPMLYANSWGLPVPDYVANELELWTDHIQNPLSPGIDWMDGGSGYTNNTEYVNMSKTGGMLLQFAVEGKALGDPDVQAALYFMDSMEQFDHWNQGATTAYSGWYGGNLGNPYAMWAVYKGLATYGGLVWNDNGTPLDPTDDFLVGNPNLISTAPGGITIGQDWGPGTTQTSLAGDWYSQYCDFLLNDPTYGQNANGSWNGYVYWTGALATGWYINILNATGAPEPIIPVPAAVLLGGIGLAVSSWRLRRRKEL